MIKDQSLTKATRILVFTLIVSLTLFTLYLRSKGIFNQIGKRLLCNRAAEAAQNNNTNKSVVFYTTDLLV
jgi:hypothetical protein